jgi:predicted Rossmann-fold nucleotide-binding protein
MAIASKEFARRVGQLLVQSGIHNKKFYQLITGGDGEVLIAACQGFLQQKDHFLRRLQRVDNNTEQWLDYSYLRDPISIQPSGVTDFCSNNWSINLPTGLQDYRNGLVAKSDAVIVVGGGAGTGNEATFAWGEKRLVIACALEEVGGTSVKIAGEVLDHRVRYPVGRIPGGDKVHVATSPEQVIELLHKLLPLHSKVHRGITKM